MHTLDTLQDSTQRRRQGQTLAEFAITLPILLIMMFGIIEFGRIFQAWVSLQNAARSAARYASTGQYYSTFKMDLESGKSDPTGFIPCVNDGLDYGGVDQRGTFVNNYVPPGSSPTITYQAYKNGLESLFATWNDGKNCDPTVGSDQDKRKDMARLLSIMQEARKGAAGLSIESDPFNYGIDKKVLDGQPWFEVWKSPIPRATSKSWFNVFICSSRQRLDKKYSTVYFQRAIGTSPRVDQDTRFVTYLGDGDLYKKSDSSLVSSPLNPGCYLNEIPSSDNIAAGATNNAGKPFLDPGGPADNVNVVITFNHPLITPLGLAPYIQMQARRTAIVESFRAPDAVNALGSGGAVIPPKVVPSDTPTYTPKPTNTPSLTPTRTPVPTATSTYTPRPLFDCSGITASNLSMSNNIVYIQLKNANQLSTFLTKVTFYWPKIGAFPGMYMSQMTLDGIPHWQGTSGQDNNPPTNTNGPESASLNLTDSDEQDRTIAGGSTGTWAGTFVNGPANMSSYTTVFDYANTTFSFANPLGGAECNIVLGPLPTPTKTLTPNPKTTNTPTFTPDCAGSNISISFVGFRSEFGLVELAVTNKRNTIAVLSDFTIQWNQRAPGILTLFKVSAKAPPGSPGSVEVWNSGAQGAQDATPPTKGKAEGTWVQNANFDANSTTSLFIDFEGGPLNSFNMQPTDFNGTTFTFGCGASGVGGGNGNGSNGIITIANPPTPVPTVPSSPTSPPTLTYTPSPKPPTNTPKPPATAGPSNTPKPTNTPKPPPTATPLPQPGGQTPVGCIDGSC